MSREKAGSGCGQGGHGGCRGPATKPSAEAGMGGGGCRQAQWRTKAGAGAVGGVVGGGHHRWYHLLQAPTQCHHAPPASQAGPAVACSRPRQAGQQATAPLLTPTHWSSLLLLLLLPPLLTPTHRSLLPLTLPPTSCPAVDLRRGFHTRGKAEGRRPPKTRVLNLWVGGGGGARCTGRGGGWGGGGRL